MSRVLSEWETVELSSPAQDFCPSLIDAPEKPLCPLDRVRYTAYPRQEEGSSKAPHRGLMNSGSGGAYQPRIMVLRNEQSPAANSQNESSFTNPVFYYLKARAPPSKDYPPPFLGPLPTPRS